MVKLFFLRGHHSETSLLKALSSPDPEVKIRGGSCPCKEFGKLVYQDFLLQPPLYRIDRRAASSISGKLRPDRSMN